MGDAKGSVTRPRRRTVRKPPITARASAPGVGSNITLAESFHSGASLTARNSPPSHSNSPAFSRCR